MTVVIKSKSKFTRMQPQTGMRLSRLVGYLQVREGKPVSEDAAINAAMNAWEKAEGVTL